MDVKEWARNGSFMKKPSNGWLHDDAALEHGDGVYYPVKYVGTIPMSMSMRDMSYEDRTAVTREAISQVCEAAGLRPPKKRKLPKLVKQCLPSDPVPKNYNIKLTISTTGIALVVIETNQVIANHIMPCVSFATGGDATDYDVIGYVAKDARNFREVHVFDCGHMAQDVIATVGQAFELRYKAYLRKQQQQASFGGEEAVYDEAGASGGGQLYDDLPSAPSARRGGPAAVMSGGGAAAAAMRGGAGAGRAASGGYGDVGGYSSQAIYDNRGPGVGGDYSDGYQETGGYQDTAGYMSTESMGGGYAQPPEYGAGDDDIQYGGQATYDNKMGTGVGTPRFKEYDNNYGVIPAAGGSTEYDDGMGDASAKLTQAPGGRELEKPLQQEGWFHGAVRREIADQLLRRNGDFLVRENMTVPNQFILSAMQDGKKKHILLVDPAGRVRTKDMSFSSVSHLINYHIRARIPIISQGSRISLGQPVVRIQSSGSAYDLDS